MSGEWATKPVKGLPITKTGCPKALKFLLKYDIASNLPLLSYVNTILYSTRSLRLGGKVDFEPLTEPGIYARPHLISKHITAFWKALGHHHRFKEIPESLRWKQFHFSTKASPNKGPALVNAISDLRAISNNGSRELIDNLCILGGPLFEVVFRHLLKYLPMIPDLLSPAIPRSIRRLTFIVDKETKVRIVAILDYFSQTVLKTFHEYLFNILKRIPSDCTFAQGKPFEKGRLSR